MVTITEVFLSFTITSVIGCCLAVAKMCYKSKCDEIQICGIRIHRDVASETRELQMQLEHGIESKNSNDVV